MALYVNGAIATPVDAQSLDGVTANLQPAGAGQDGYVVTFNHANNDLELAAPSGGGSSLPTATGADQLPVSDGAGTAYTATSAGDVLALGMVHVLGGEVAGTALVSDGAGDVAMTSADVSAVLAAADAAAARTALSVYSAAEVDAAVAGAGGFPTPLLLTSLNATVSDATPGTDGSAAIDADGLITLSTENALAFSFNNGPKISKAFTLDAGSRFRARVRLVSKAGPSSDTIVGLYYGGWFAVYARISGQIGVWDLGAGVPATSLLTALWNGTEYLEMRVSDGLVQYGFWQGTVFTPFYAALRNDQASSVGVVMSSVPAGATQTVVLDGFAVTDLRAW